MTSIQDCHFRGFLYGAVFFFCKGRKHGAAVCCVGCSNTKDEIKGFSIHQIPFYGDTRSEAVKRRGKWISFVNGNRKHWTPSKYSGALLGAFRTRRFHSHVSLFFRLTVLSEAFLNFIDRTLSKDIQLKINR